MRFIHRALSESRASGFTGVPELAKTEGGETVLVFADRLYDAQDWLVGEPLSKIRPGGGPTPNVVVSLSATRMASLATALARFHSSTTHLSPEREEDACPLPARLTRIAEDTEARHEALLSDMQARAEGEERVVALRWLELLPRALVSAREISETLPEATPEDYVLCHGDLWPAHIHFDGDTFVGFTDFESLCFATPALDLAQSALHFGGWKIRENILRCYEAVAPLNGRERTALLIEAVADLVGEGYWSLEALYGDTSSLTTSTQRAAHELNLRKLIGSLEQVVEETRNI